MSKVPLCVEQLKNCFATQLHRPEQSIVGMLVGAPAVAKTSYIRQIANVMGYRIIPLLASRMSPEDFNGYPGRFERQTKDGVKYEVSGYAPWDWQMRILKEKKVIIFLDEFSNARPDVQAVLLSFIQDREFPTGIDGKPVKLPKETIIVGAMNPPEESADGFDISEPMANRMTWIPWRIPVADWIAAFEEDFSPQVINRQIADMGDINKDTVKSNYKRWKQLIIGFISTNQGLLHLQNGTKELSSAQVYGMSSNNPSERTVMENAWASGRSWHNLANMLACLPPSQQSNEMLVERICQSTVGVKASSEFLRYVRKMNEFDPEQLIANPESLTEEQYASLSPENAHDLMVYIEGLDQEYLTKHQVLGIVDVLERVGKNSQSTVASKMSQALKLIGSFLRSKGNGDMSNEEVSQLRMRVMTMAKLYSRASKMSLK